MSVTTINYTMQVPKELKEVVDLLDAILENIMAKKSVAEYGNILDELMAAVEGIGGVSEEIKSEFRDEAAGYLVHKLLGRLLPAPVPAPVTT